jgi:hypothetical protein
MGNKNYINECAIYAKKLNTSLTRGNFEYADICIAKINEAYDRLKEEHETWGKFENSNFGIINHIFEESLPTLFATNKKAINEYIKTMKNDKNLMLEYGFIKAIKNCGNDTDAKKLVNESVELIENGINYATINESNKKLAKIVKKYKMDGADMITEQDKKLYEDCDFIFKHKKSFANINELNERSASIASYANENRKETSINNTNKLDELKNVEKAAALKLRENEYKLFKNIISNDPKKQKEAFNVLKTECINSIDKSIKETKDEERSNLVEIKNDVMSKEFSNETIFEDVKKFINLKNIIEGK